MHNMKAPNILPLLYCIEILGVLLCGVQSEAFPTDSVSNTNETPNFTITAPDQTTREDKSMHRVFQGASSTSLTSAASSTSEASNLMSSESTVTQSVPKYSNSPRPCPNPTTPTSIFYKMECLQVLMVAGGLILACAILLVSTLLLMWKVCQLSRRIKMLSSNADLISNSEYWMGTATKDKSKSVTEAKETSMLMADVSQTQEEVGNSTTKEEEENVIKDGEMEGENKKESGDTADSEEASAGENKKETLVIGDENPSSPKLQEEAADSQSAKAVAASSSEGTEEPKDVV